MTFDRITRDPAVNGGRATVRGTGVTVGQVLGAFAAGKTRVDILGADPELASDDIDAVLAFAKQQVRGGEIPDVDPPGGPLTPAELVEFKFPQEASDRLEALIRRSKVTRLPPEEETEVEDCLRLDHIFTLVKVKARRLVVAG